MPLEGDILTRADLRAALSAPEGSRRSLRPVQHDETPIIELRNFRYTYLEGTPRANEAIRDVSFEIQPRRARRDSGSRPLGQVHRRGLLRPPPAPQAWAGLLRGRGRSRPGYDRAALRREVGIVFQQPDSQIIEDVVGADVAFGPTAAGIPAEETRRRVEESLNALGLPTPSTGSGTFTRSPAGSAAGSP